MSNNLEPWSKYVSQNLNIFEKQFSKRIIELNARRSEEAAFEDIEDSTYRLALKQVYQHHPKSF